MTPQQILRYQLALLLAASGRSRILATLAELLKLREGELETLLADLEKLEPKGPTKHKSSGAQQTLDHLLAQHPDKADALRTLHARFVNKTLLVELRDVRRFLEGYSHPSRALKSRTDALPKLLEVWAGLDSSDLKRLCEQPDSGGYSSLGIISDHILGRDRE